MTFFQLLHPVYFCVKEKVIYQRLGLLRELFENVPWLLQVLVKEFPWNQIWLFFWHSANICLTSPHFVLGYNLWMTPSLWTNHFTADNHELIIYFYYLFTLFTTDWHTNNVISHNVWPMLLTPGHFPHYI